MSGTTIKYWIRISLFAILLLPGISLAAQERDASRSLMLTIGGGYGHYFNIFTNVLDEDIKNNRPSLYAKLVWQPEHLLGLGFESGYYEFYSTTRIETGSTSQKLTTNLNVIPLFLSFSVKATHHLKVNFATGVALMDYTILVNKLKKGALSGQSLSMSDFTAGISWFVPVGKRIEFGTELKYLYIGKTGDHHVSAFLNLSYNIINRPVK
jgi:hypothetical protein